MNASRFRLAVHRRLSFGALAAVLVALAAAAPADAAGRFRDSSLFGT